MTESPVTYTTKDGDMLDLICVTHYGRASGTMERVLEANPGLADLGAIYAQGVRIVLPVIPKPSRQFINLLA